MARMMLDGGGGGAWRPSSGRGGGNVTAFRGTKKAKRASSPTTSYQSTQKPTRASSPVTNYQAPSRASSPQQTYQPRQAYTPPAPSYNTPPTPSYGGNTNSFAFPSNDPIGGGGYGGGGFNPAPIPKPEPISEEDWLAGDSDYQEQVNEYSNELKDFLARLATKKSEFTEDYETALAGLGRNRESGLDALGEDFTARGLAYSGMFMGNGGANDQAKAGYERQENSMEKSSKRGLADFASQRAEKEKATKLSRGNAQRASLQRMAMDQMF